MDYTALLVQLLPASVLPYLKFVVTVLGGAASSVVATYPGVDHRWVVAAAILTAATTYLTPNVQPVAVAETAVQSDDAAPAQYINTLDPAEAPTGTASTPVVEVPAAAPVQHEIGV